MKYEGRIYGKVAGKYIEIHTTKDLDQSIKNAENSRRLLEALEIMVQYFDNSENGAGETSAIMQAKEAIAKAYGENE